MISSLLRRTAALLLSGSILTPKTARAGQWALAPSALRPRSVSQTWATPMEPEQHSQTTGQGAGQVPTRLGFGASTLYVGMAARPRGWWWLWF